MTFEAMGVPETVPDAHYLREMSRKAAELRTGCHDLRIQMMRHGIDEFGCYRALRDLDAIQFQLDERISAAGGAA